MKRANLIEQDLRQTETLEDLTAVFESIASIHIANIRNRVVASKEFFGELWQVYSSLRVDPAKRLKHRGKAGKSGRAAVIITSEGKFGGGMNDKIVDTFFDSYPASKQPEVIALGVQGVAALKHRGANLKRAFRMPPGDTDINVGAVIRALQSYEQIVVFYQTYDSLRSQKVARIDLLSKVQEYGEAAGESKQMLNQKNYIFEPGVAEIVDYMESIMMGVALTQVVMETKLAGYAARYNTMSMAKKRASALVGDFRRDYQRARRTEGDERIKEGLKALRYRRSSGGER